MEGKQKYRAGGKRVEELNWRKRDRKDRKTEAQQLKEQQQ